MDVDPVGTNGFCMKESHEILPVTEVEMQREADGQNPSGILSFMSISVMGQLLGSSTEIAGL